jgi:chromosome condensin MukBEF complex kleisin-like MukF subunit
MKTQEEIKQLAEKHYTQITLSQRTAFKLGYTQCQEDMADKKYTEGDILFAFVHGGTKFEENKDADTLAKNFKELINSLNKQD